MTQSTGAQRSAIDRVRNPSPEDRAALYLANAIHIRCGSEPDHGPYRHGDEAAEYAALLHELGLLVDGPSDARPRAAAPVVVPDESRALLPDRPTSEDVDPGYIGAIRRGPRGDGVVRVANVGAADWLMLVGGSRYTDAEVAGWPVIGAMSGTPAAWMAGEPLPANDDDPQ